MNGLELETLHLGQGTSYVLITPVSIKPDYFPKARMHDSSILIDHCQGTRKTVCVYVYVSERKFCMCTEKLSQIDRNNKSDQN